MAYLTPEQYLEIERKEEWKNVVRGRNAAHAASGPGDCLIVGNVGCLLSEQLLSRPCDVLMSAMHLLVPATGYPDVTRAVC